MTTQEFKQRMNTIYDTAVNAVRYIGEAKQAVLKAETNFAYLRGYTHDLEMALRSSELSKYKTEIQSLIKAIDALKSTEAISVLTKLSQSATSVSAKSGVLKRYIRS